MVCEGKVPTIVKFKVVLAQSWPETNEANHMRVSSNKHPYFMKHSYTYIIPGIGV